MKLRTKKFEIILVIIFFFFSWWLMDKSFGYDTVNHKFRIARHQVGDFGLHLSLIRSFSWGDNFPVESPFFPGRPLPYHYYFDFLVGMLEKSGVRIDIAFNGLSIFSFTLLLFLIYKIPQIIFEEKKILGLFSVILFIFHSNLTFVDFFKEKGFSLFLLRDLWLLPDYLNKGPFDDSLILIFFTLNIFLNQRHLVAGLAISLSIFYYLLARLLKSQKISAKSLIFLGVVLGFSSRLHSLIFFGTVVVLLFLCMIFRRFRWSLYIFVPALIFSSFHIKTLLNQDLSHSFFNPGFLVQKPLTLKNFWEFWSLNLGVAMFLIPLGVYLSKSGQRKIFYSVFLLFLIGNIFQLSFRVDHNHSLFNFFLIFANFYVAYFLVWLFKKKSWGKILFLIFLFFLTISGLIDLMTVKNDFQYPLDDAPANKFMQWIKESTDRRDIFLAREEIFDPVTLAGRRNYFGHRYYLEVMGYNFSKKELLARSFFEVEDLDTLKTMRKEGISYLVIPISEVSDFHYEVNSRFLQDNLKMAYQDDEVLVFKL